MNWHNYFPINILASWVAQDPHKQYQMSGLEPYASDSRGRLFCTQQSCNICSLHRHWDWIPLAKYVSLFAISSVVCSTRILPNGFDYPIYSENPPVGRWSSISSWYISDPVICELYTDKYLPQFCLSTANVYGNMALTMARWRSRLPSHGAQMNLSTTSTILIWLIHRVDRPPLSFL